MDDAGVMDAWHVGVLLRAEALGGRKGTTTYAGDAQEVEHRDELDRDR